jgi:uroporphyrinogen decarboxylase
VKFINGIGPKLDKFNFKLFTKSNRKSFTQKLQPVYDAINKTRDKLHKEKSLIAFVGAPWTLLVYMLDLKLNKSEIDYQKINLKAKEVKSILNELNDYLSTHIENQINAGADVVQIFDSWAGLIQPENFVNYCIEPNFKLVNFCKSKKIPVICFPRGIGDNYKKFNDMVKPDGINIDYEINPNWAKMNLKDVVIQGGLDPKILLNSEEEIMDNVKKYLDAFKGLPYIFNLGHGLLPTTDPDKVEKLIKFYRNY